MQKTKRGGGETLRGQFLGEGLAVIQHMMRAQGANPVLRFRPRGRGDDLKVGELAGQLNGDGADAAGAADDEDAKA